MPYRFKSFLTATAFLFILPGTYALYEAGIGNFHAITDGEAYRSAQLDSNHLEYYVKKYGIKSILNLRGKHAGARWYMEEIRVSAAHKVPHYDIALSSTREPTEEDVRKLTEIFKSAPRPILIHCKSGADRSGLVAAMWKVIVDKEPKTEAVEQLSILYGHIPVSKTYAMDRFFQNWNPSQ